MILVNLIKPCYARQFSCILPHNVVVLQLQKKKRFLVLYHLIGI